MGLVKIPRNLDRQIKAWERLANSDTTAVVLDAGVVVAQAAVKEIQSQAAHGSSDWAQIAKALEVKRARENVVVWIPTDKPEAQRGYDLEYGTEDIAPSPVMHTALSRGTKARSALFSKTLADRMFKPTRKS